MADTGAQHSVLNKKLGPMSKKTSLVQGATGTKRYYWTTEWKVNLGTQQVSHSFLVIPECPAPLLGRAETIAPDVQLWVHKYPLAWAETAGMGLAKQRHPVVIGLKAEAIPVRMRQYPMSQEARRGITPHIQRLMGAGILKQCQSPWNTPLLLVKKLGGGGG